MDRTIPVAHLIEDMRPGESLVFNDQKPTTISRTVTRIKARQKPVRDYMCRSTPNGYTVWRLS